jgi:hypothetical protein
VHDERPRNTLFDGSATYRPSANVVCVAPNLTGNTRDGRDKTEEVIMSRAFTRALVISTIGGLAVAPALAYAADNGSNAPTAQTATVTTLTAPKHALGGHGFTLSAKVSPEAQAAPAGDEPTAKGQQAGQDTQKAKKGKGTKGKGKGNKHHRQRAETGAVTFVVDGKTLTPVTLSRGRANEKIELPPGNHTVTATYGGDENYRGSHSAPVTFTVN